jgi:3-hydroxyacyl-[acyl-carrier-protein] dehydratase
MQYASPYPACDTAFACNRPPLPYNCPGSRTWRGRIREVKFNLLDNVISIDESRIVATKTVSLAEEYLADHFPKFPVLPGVMMLEALTQAAGWLMHHRTGFAKSMAVLREAKNVKYGTFVAPGNTLVVEVDFVKETPAGALFKATSNVNGDTAISGRLEIAYFDLSDKDPSYDRGDIDPKIKAFTRQRWAVLNTHRAAPAPTL